MSRHAFDPNCPDCRPVLMDAKTHQRLPDDHPANIALQKVWATAPREQQEAFHRITVLNGRDPADMELMQSFWLKVQAADPTAS